MNIFLKIKFWSFLVIGVVLILIGGYLFPYGPDKRIWAEACLFVGVGQLLIFAVLFFLRYRKRSKGTVQA
jgi:hypothetical protein